MTPLVLTMQLKMRARKKKINRDLFLSSFVASISFVLLSDVLSLKTWKGISGRRASSPDSSLLSDAYHTPYPLIEVEMCLIKIQLLCFKMASRMQAEMIHNRAELFLVGIKGATIQFTSVSNDEMRISWGCFWSKKRCPCSSHFDSHKILFS